jgi:hypothetical protein
VSLSCSGFPQRSCIVLEFQSHRSSCHDIEITYHRLRFIQMDLLEDVKTAIAPATHHAWNKMSADGHWCTEIHANVMVTAEQTFFYASLGQTPPGGCDPYRRYILSQQNKDGSWGLAPNYPSDVSTTCDAYLALKICGQLSYDDTMQRARASRSRCRRRGEGAHVHTNLLRHVRFVPVACGTLTPTRVHFCSLLGSL